MDWASFWATFLQTHLVTLLSNESFRTTPKMQICSFSVSPKQKIAAAIVADRVARFFFTTYQNVETFIPNDHNMSKMTTHCPK
jgi:hypothetical protein